MIKVELLSTWVCEIVYAPDQIPSTIDYKGLKYLIIRVRKTVNPMVTHSGSDHISKSKHLTENDV